MCLSNKQNMLKDIRKSRTEKTENCGLRNWNELGNYSGGKPTINPATIYLFLFNHGNNRAIYEIGSKFEQVIVRKALKQWQCLFCWFWTGVNPLGSSLCVNSLNANKRQVCRANQLSSFYMMATLAFNELTHSFPDPNNSFLIFSRPNFCHITLECLKKCYILL